LISQPTLISFISGLAVILVLSLLQKRGAFSKTTAAILAFALLFVGNFYYFGWRLPQEQHAEKIAEAVRHLALQPVWRTVKAQQPDLYKKIEQEYLTTLKEGGNEAEAQQRLRPDLADLLNQRLAYASDSDVVAYMRISVEEMMVLRQKDPNLCFKFLFPQVSGGINTDELLPESLLSREKDAMDSFLQHASETVTQQDVSSANRDLHTTVRTLYRKWGSDLQTLNTPAEPDINRTKLCDMTLDLYQSVLALPVKRSAAVLRIILSGNAN